MEKMFEKIKKLKEYHPGLYEFVLFNIMSNVATIINFAVLWIGNGLLFTAFVNRDFSWFIFEYPREAGGLCSFLAFSLAYICAQTANFFVQRKVVFGATGKLSKILPWYIVTVLIAGIISIWLPPHVIAIVQPYVNGGATTLANVVNIVVQVLINYPMMKFVIMKKK